MFLPEKSGGHLLPQFNLPLEYTIPYRWGSLQVTEEAHEAYGLIPLTLTVEADKHDELPKTNSSIDLLIVGPDQLVDEDAKYQGRIMISSTAKTSKDKIQIAMGLNGDLDTINKEIKSSLFGFLGVEELESTEALGLSEQLEHDTPQMIVHRFIDGIDEYLPLVYSVWAENNHNKKFIKSMTTLGGIALGIPTLQLAAIAATDLVIDTQSLLISSAASFGALLKVRKEVKDKLTSSGSNEHMLRIASELATKVVCSDIHSSFCSHEFDSEFRNRPTTED